MPDRSLYRGTYGEVVCHAKKLASALQKIGIKQFDTAGYSFSAEQSSDKEWVFLRKQAS
jgi:cytoplasmic iron level regulating protein YaaA (DUF328/UPF0246 family)